MYSKDTNGLIDQTVSALATILSVSILACKGMSVLKTYENFRKVTEEEIMSVFGDI